MKGTLRTINGWLEGHASFDRLMALGHEDIGQLPTDYAFIHDDDLFEDGQAQVTGVINRYDRRILIMRDRKSGVHYTVEQDKLDNPARFALFAIPTALLATGCAFGVMAAGSALLGAKITAMGLLPKVILFLLTEAVAIIPTAFAALFALFGPPIYTSTTFGLRLGSARSAELYREEKTSSRQSALPNAT